MIQEVLVRLKKGDESALNELFDQYYVKLLKYALLQIAEPMVAEEIVQDTFIYLWKKRTSLSIESSLEAYMFKSVKNKCLNYVKSKVHRMNILMSGDEIISNMSASMDDLETEELHELIELALRSLPPQTSMIYSFSRNAGLTYTEIAEKLNVSKKTIEYHVSSALRLIKKYLEKNGYGFLASLALLQS